MVQAANTVYLDCFSGISGDMLLGALLDIGVSEEALRGELNKLGLEPFTFKVTRQTRQSIGALSVQITSESDQQFRNLATISDLLEQSSLDPAITERALKVFRRLAQAEAKVHGKPVDEIHFHEVGALDTIIDIVGVIAGLHLLGITSVHCSPLPLGRGFVDCAHGTLPLPAPAVCELLENIPVIGIETDLELVTPTGAALVAELADSVGPMPPMIVSATGYGAGDSPGTPGRPNLLRIISGRMETVTEAQQVEVIETSLDDWNPEGFPYLCAKLLEANALDVNLAPIQMKKGRPGFRLTAVCRAAEAPLIKELIFNETSAIGLRFRTEQRMTLVREIITVETRYGPVQAKKVVAPAGVKIYPEYESCKDAAASHDVPLDQVYREVITRSAEAG
ncbi:MAG: nickel pincer cofactor biosynthesis protein LarC [Desulfofustis sp.]|nr:nickel pincer cofactor biosynthesis protein LarC [Desulfofustis sp.]